MPGKLTLLHELDFSVLQQCIHCGMCLPSCPTYRETGRERNSPRGRIALMRAVAENELPLSKGFADEMNDCLGCLACTSACPAGVDFAELLETARTASEESNVVPSRLRRLLRWALLRQLFLRRGMLQAVGRLLFFYQRSGAQAGIRQSGAIKLLPRRIRELEAMMPRFQAKFSNELIAERESSTSAIGVEQKTGGTNHPVLVKEIEPSGKPRRYRVALLTGCVQDLVYAEVNRATADVLLVNHCDVFTPRLQGCCGSLHAHNGDLDTARRLARRLIDTIEPATVDAIISNAAGCGSHLKHYGRLLADDKTYGARALAWDAKVRDISEWLVEINFRRPTSSPFPVQAERIQVTYHDACHLCHGQGITRQPREILRSLPGVEVRECAEATWCCGAAGIYAVTHPKTAADLRLRKWKKLEETGATIVAMGNPGCALHLDTKPGEAKRAEIVHPVVLLARAYALEK